MLLGPLTPDFYLQKAVFDLVFSSTVFHRFDTTDGFTILRENPSRQASSYVLVAGPQWFGPISVLCETTGIYERSFKRDESKK